MDARAGDQVLGWVLYDGGCGFCSRWVPFWSHTLRRRGFAIATLQSPLAAELVPLDEAERTADLRLVLADGRQVAGADVYRHVMRRIWWALPLYLLSRTWGFRRVFDWGYRTFAVNRYRISATCGLRGQRQA
ncbi:MAG: DUF393 domain-containing protein [Planctomycetota bacterium]